MYNGLYHREIFMPARVLLAFSVPQPIGYNITNHAKQAARSDRYGQINVPPAIKIQAKEIVEAEFESGSLIKLVVRKPYNETCDAIYVIGLRPSGNFLKTVWLNQNSDKHATLNRYLYQTK